MKKFKLTPDQLAICQPLLDSAAFAGASGMPNVVIAQIRFDGTVMAEYLDHDTAIDVVAAKAGFVHASHEDRNKIMAEWTKRHAAEQQDSNIDRIIEEWNGKAGVPCVK